MNLIVCIDEMGGMSFGNRRCSRDSAVCSDIKLQCLGAKIHMNEYSAKLFGEMKNLCINADPLSAAGRGEYCFAENIAVSGSDSIEMLIIYRWNRSYPADNFLKIDLTQWKMVSSRDFPGSSHENITKEVYMK